MDWLMQDWEYPNDHIYAMERQKDIESSWQEWEEEQNRKPAAIKVLIPIKKDEVISRSKAVRRTYQTRL